MGSLHYKLVRNSSSYSDWVNTSPKLRETKIKSCPFPQQRYPIRDIMALQPTQPLTEMSARNISWSVKAAGAHGSQPYHLHVPIV
jgi:hypothetical protein